MVVSLVIVLLASAASNADIYKWKDAEGRTHISDTPPVDGEAERLQIRTFSGPADVSSAGGERFAQRVVVLSTAWCGVCRQARTWLTQKGVAFTEYDVERTDTGKAEYRRLNGRGVPIILVGDMRMDGFSAARLEAMLAK